MNIPSALYAPSGAIYNYTFVEDFLIYVSSQTGIKIKEEQRYHKPHFIFLILASLEKRSQLLNPYFSIYVSKQKTKLYRNIYFVTG